MINWIPPYDSSNNPKYESDNPSWKSLKLYNIKMHINNIWHWFYYRTVCKRHIIKLPIKPSYIDVDEMMFLACFEALGDFVEYELGKKEEFSEWPTYKGYRLHSSNEKAIDLWLWYKEERKNGFPSGWDVEDIKFNELMLIRKGLWT